MCFVIPVELETGSLPPSPADSGVSDVDSSSGHTSNDELKSRLQSSGKGKTSFFIPFSLSSTINQRCRIVWISFPFSLSFLFPFFCCLAPLQKQHTNKKTKKKVFTATRTTWSIAKVHRQSPLLPLLPLLLLRVAVVLVLVVVVINGSSLRQSSSTNASLCFISNALFTVKKQFSIITSFRLLLHRSGNIRKKVFPIWSPFHYFVIYNMYAVSMGPRWSLSLLLPLSYFFPTSLFRWVSPSQEKKKKKLSLNNNKHSPFRYDGLLFSAPRFLFFFKVGQYLESNRQQKLVVENGSVWEPEGINVSFVFLSSSSLCSHHQLDEKKKKGGNPK